MVFPPSSEMIEAVRGFLLLPMVVLLSGHPEPLLIQDRPVCLRFLAQGVQVRLESVAILREKLRVPIRTPSRTEVPIAQPDDDLADDVVDCGPLSGTASAVDRLSRLQLPDLFKGLELRRFLKPHKPNSRATGVAVAEEAPSVSQHVNTAASVVTVSLHVEGVDATLSVVWEAPRRQHRQNTCQNGAFGKPSSNSSL